MVGKFTQHVYVKVQIHKFTVTYYDTYVSVTFPDAYFMHTFKNLKKIYSIYAVTVRYFASRNRLYTVHNCIVFRNAIVTQLLITCRKGYNTYIVHVSIRYYVWFTVTVCIPFL